MARRAGEFPGVVVPEAFLQLVGAADMPQAGSDGAFKEIDVMHACFAVCSAPTLAAAGQGTITV
jgi:hypothetical protein